MQVGSTYSFLDVTCTIGGPGFSSSLGEGSGNAEEGITIQMVGDKNTMLTGADHTVMHSLHATNAGTVSVKLFQVSPKNALLQAAYNATRMSSSLWGKNTISIEQKNSKDTIVCNTCAFQKQPDISYANNGAILTWSFHCGQIIGMLGTY